MMPELGGFVFGLFLLAATLVGMLGISWILAEAILFLLPGIQPYMHRRLGLETYRPGGGAPTHWTPRPEDHAVQDYLHSIPSHTVPVVAEQPSRAPEADAVDHHDVALSFLRDHLRAQPRAARRPHEFKMLSEQHRCPGCKKPRRVFHIVDRLCVRCVVDRNLGQQMDSYIGMPLNTAAVAEPAWSDVTPLDLDAFSPESREEASHGISECA